MGKIPLRAYNKQIETLIDRGSIDEAIANSKFILQSYPKCIATYRNLSKALLESKRFSEAEDIFDRVLSAYPDDFVSHIGISIIKENEGNLDAAIWHMELAYDIQPSNPALTSELRRLFGRRDGVQPPKIRLTRGALIRMYARGELYQQAIAEILSAISADPKRIDLEVILAEMYYFSGSMMEATEVCSRLLSKLPYCFTANHLMMQIVTRTPQSGDARIYKNRLAELDPYFAFITTADDTGDEIPEDQVQVALYTGDGSQSEESELPRTTEADWQKITEAEKLYWIEDNAELEPDVPTALPPEGTPEDILEASITRSLKVNNGEPPEVDSLSIADDIPDWMRSAGWIPATHPEQEPLDNSDTPLENISSGSDEIQPAELPVWLGTAAPQMAKAGSMEEERLPDIDTSSENETIVPEEDLRVSNVGEPDSDMKEIPSSKSEWSPEPSVDNPKPQQGETGEKMPTDSSVNNENEWLNQFRNDAPNKGEENDLPDWLKDFESDQNQPIEESMDIPEWLKSLEPIESSPAGAIPDVSGSKDEAFPKEEESAITGTSYMFTKPLTDDEIKAGKYDTAYIEPESQSFPADWEASDEKQPEKEAEIPAEPALQDEVFPKEEEEGSVITGTSYMFTKALTEEEVRSGKLDSTYLAPEAHPLPSDWEDSLGKTPEPPAEPVKETKSALPAWVKNALKSSSPTETPPPPQPVVPPPMPPSEQVEPEKSSILDQMPTTAAPVEAEENEKLAGQFEPAEAAPLNETEVPAPGEPILPEGGLSAEELGDEPVQDLAAGPQGDGAISEDTNTELLDWLRGFDETEEAPGTEKGIEEATGEETSENPLDRLGDFVQPKEEAVTGISEASAVEGVESVPESIEETVILHDEAPVAPQEHEPAKPVMEETGVETSEQEPWTTPQEPTSESTPAEEPVEPVFESMLTAFSAPLADLQSESPVPETLEPAVESALAEPMATEEESPSEAVETVWGEEPTGTNELEVAQVAPEEFAPSAEENAVVEPEIGSPISEPVTEVIEPVQKIEAIAEPMPVVPDPLHVAQTALENGDLALALNEFTMAIHDESKLPSVIEALKSATDTHGEENDLWQLLGDAFAHTKDFDQAFSAYDKAESLLLNLTK